MTTLSAQRLAQVFVEVSDTLVDEFDLLDFLHMLTMRTAELSGAGVVGLVLADKHGRLQFMAASREDARLLELFQLQNDEGPCLDAFHSGTPVVNTDLRADTRRWPRFAPHAVRAGFRSVHAFPLRLRSQVIGALNVFGADDGGRLDTDDVPIVQALADMASIALLQERIVREGQVLTEQLQGALNSRVIIEQAKGAIAQSRGVSVDEAFVMMRAYARRSNRRLGEVARAVVADIDCIPELEHGRRPPAGGKASAPGVTPNIELTGSGGATSMALPIRRGRAIEGVLSLVATGEIDMAASGHMDAAIREALGDGRVTKLVVDLQQVTFIDSFGIRTLIYGHRLAADHNVHFQIVNPSDLVRRVLDITGVLAVLSNDA